MQGPYEKFLQYHTIPAKIEAEVLQNSMKRKSFGYRKTESGG